MNQEEKLPVTLLSGFLGSGKTTLLNHLLLQQPNTAVLMNEFGEIALDHQLVETNSSTVALLSGGCVCCQIQGSLSPTLKNLYMGRRDGSVPNFQRLIIETTGLADPTPIIATLTREYWVASKYRLDAVVTLVDAQFGDQQLDEHFEAVRQVACADLILLSKSDLVEESELGQLQQRLYQLNPQADVEMVKHGEIDSKHIFNREKQRQTETVESLSAVLSQAGATLQPIAPTGLSPAPKAVPESQHDDKIRSISLTLEKPLSRWGASEALSLLMRFNTDTLLRVKGIVEIEGEENPLVINGVHHQLYEPYSLDGWPDDQRLSRLVFIVADANQALLNESLDKYTAVAGSDADETERNAFEVWLVQKQLQQLLNPSSKG